jgi:hypothetical protein
LRFRPPVVTALVIVASLIFGYEFQLQSYYPVGLGTDFICATEGFCDNRFKDNQQP